MRSVVRRVRPGSTVGGFCLVAILAAGCGAPSTAPPASTPQAQSSPSSATVVPSSANAVAILDGRYVGTQQRVSDILDLLLADRTLSASQKVEIETDILDIRGATTLQTALEVRNGNEIASTMRTDDEPFPVARLGWPMVSLDHTVLVGVPCCGEEALAISGDGQALTLKFISPASGPTETFVRHVLFELPTFRLAPVGP